MQSITSITLGELESRMSEIGEARYRAKQIMEWLYGKRVRSFSQMTNLPPALRAKLEELFDNHPLRMVRSTGAHDSTRKFLFALEDGQLVESVLIPASPALYGEASDRRTICVSTQVGCAYGCRFCASGLDGWKRNLDPAEIVDQILAVEEISGEKVNNIVFMGMGEPLANFDNLMRALGVINARWGVGIGARRITISTSGLVPRIRDLADQPLNVRLAISLHGATDAVRSQIMPVNRKYPLADLLSACAYYTARKHHHITFEYILIDGVNDGADQARMLACHASPLNAKVNLIPYNAVDGLSWNRSSREAQQAFLRILHAARVSATIRLEKGHDIAAACGQLRLKTQRENSFAPANGLL